MRGPRLTLERAALVAALLAPTPAAASPPAAPAVGAPAAAARALFDQAEQASRELRLADALRSYREALAADPSAPFAPAARNRAADLAARAEGGFAPLARLEAVRRDPARLGDRAAALAFERDVDAFPPGRVRSEARALLADALRRRLGDAEGAARALEQVLADPEADGVARGLALGQLVALHRERGDLAAARDAVDRHPDLAPGLRLEVIRASRRVTLRWIAAAALSLLALVAAVAVLRAHRRGEDLGRLLRPRAVALSLYLGGAAATLTRLHGGADPRPFLWLGLGVLGVDIAARSLQLAVPHLGRLARAGWALCCVAGVLAAAFLALERTDADYLEGFGL